MEVFYAGIAMFAFVFLQAFQSRNVAFDHYWPVIPTSLLMACAQVYVISAVARGGYDLAFVFSIGSGGGVGALLAMWLHRRLFRGAR